MTNEVLELARVTCEEVYTDPPECEHCGGYGYLGVEDELCMACDNPKTEGTWVVSADLFEDMRDDEIPF